MFTEPTVEERAAQPTVGIRTQVPMSEFGEAIPRLHGEVFAWLSQRGIAPGGPPFIRFHVIDMNGDMDVEMGVPVAEPQQGAGRVAGGELPAGRYASLVYTGVANGMEANRILLDWGAQRGLAWDRWDDPRGDAFGGRYESFLTGPEDDPDMAKWQTNVAIRLADA